MHSFLRHRLPLILALAAGGVWLGCGTDNGDASGEDPEGYPPDETTGDDDDNTGGNALDSGSGSRDASKADAGDAGDLPVPDGGGNTCVDNEDPGASESLAKQLGETPDSDNSIKTVTGVLNGFLDTDFYTLSVKDTFGSNIDQEFKTTTSGIEFCVFVKCKSGDTNFDSCTGGVKTTSSINNDGCCATGPSEATPNWSCGGITSTDDSADFYVRIKQTADACTPYQWTYRF